MIKIENFNNATVAEQARAYADTYSKSRSFIPAITGIYTPDDPYTAGIVRVHELLGEHPTLLHPSNGRCGFATIQADGTTFKAGNIETSAPDNLTGKVMTPTGRAGVVTRVDDSSFMGGSSTYAGRHAWQFTCASTHTVIANKPRIQINSYPLAPYRRYVVDLSIRLDGTWPFEITADQGGSGLPKSDGLFAQIHQYDANNPIPYDQDEGNPIILATLSGSRATIVHDGIAEGMGRTLDPSAQIPSASAATATTGGTIAASTLCSYQVCAVYGDLSYSKPSVITTVTTGAGSTNSNTITWAAVTGAIMYVVYGRTTTTVNGTTVAATKLGDTTALTFTDTGAAGVAPAAPVASGTSKYIQFGSSDKLSAQWRLNSVPMIASKYHDFRFDFFLDTKGIQDGGRGFLRVWKDHVLIHDSNSATLWPTISNGVLLEAAFKFGWYQFGASSGTDNTTLNSTAGMSRSRILYIRRASISEAL